MGVEGAFYMMNQVNQISANMATSEMNLMHNRYDDNEDQKGECPQRVDPDKTKMYILREDDKVWVEIDEFGSGMISAEVTTSDGMFIGYARIITNGLLDFIMKKTDEEFADEAVAAAMRDLRDKIFHHNRVVRLNKRYKMEGD